MCLIFILPPPFTFGFGIKWYRVHCTVPPVVLYIPWDKKKLGMGLGYQPILTLPPKQGEAGAYAVRHKALTRLPGGNWLADAYLKAWRKWPAQLPPCTLPSENTQKPKNCPKKYINTRILGLNRKLTHYRQK